MHFCSHPLSMELMCILHIEKLGIGSGNQGRIYSYPHQSGARLYPRANICARGSARFEAIPSLHMQCSCIQLYIISSTGIILYFLEISPRRDLISRHCTMLRQFEGGQILRAASTVIDTHTHTQFQYFSNNVCTYNVRAHTYIVVDPLPCSEISRAAFIGMSWLKYEVTFQGRWDFGVQQDFEEIQ